MTITQTRPEINIGPIGQIPPGEGREFVANGTRIAVFRLRSGHIRATQAECPHRMGPLSDGLVGGEALICPFHGWKFDLSTGAILLGGAPGAACDTLRVYPARVSPGGDIYLTVAPEA